MSLITPDLLRQLAPRCDADTWASALAAAADEFAITTPQRVSQWLAQLVHESAGLTRTEESLNYSVDGLMKTFSRARISAADCARLGRQDSRPADQQAIANLVYGGEWGRLNLGNIMPGDGWLFRGRSPTQTTGRANYKAAGNRIGVDLEEQPGKLAIPVIGARAAAAFWQAKGLNELADIGRFLEITQRVNGGQLGAAERQAILVKATSILMPADRRTA